MNKGLRIWMLLPVVAVGVAACGGGGKESDSSNDESPPQAAALPTFTLQLTGIAIDRVSNGDVLEVNVSGISSGVVSLEP